MVPTKNTWCWMFFIEAQTCRNPIGHFHREGNKLRKHSPWIVGHKDGEFLKRALFSQRVNFARGPLIQFVRNINVRYFSRDHAMHMTLLQFKPMLFVYLLLVLCKVTQADGEFVAARECQPTVFK